LKVKKRQPTMSATMTVQTERSQPMTIRMGGGRRTWSWLLQVIVALILFQTLFFKFTAA